MFYIITKMVTTQNKTSRKIIDKLRLKNEKMLSKEEIIKTIGDYQKIYKRKVNLISLWTYLRKNNYIKRILKDYYYIYSLEERHDRYCKFSEEELIFLVLEKLKAKWYLGLENALKENKISWQALNITIIINNKFSGIKKLGNSKFKFIKTKFDAFQSLVKNFCPATNSCSLKGKSLPKLALATQYLKASTLYLSINSSAQTAFPLLLCIPFPFGSKTKVPITTSFHGILLNNK